MYAVVRQYTFDTANSDEINSKVRDGFVAILRNSPGFVAYYWMNTGDGRGVSWTVFEDKEGAEESVRQAASFVQEHLAGLVSKPVIVEGEVKAHG